jgi:hypothetical protein
MAWKMLHYHVCRIVTKYICRGLCIDFSGTMFLFVAIMKSNSGRFDDSGRFDEHSEARPSPL